MGAWGYGPFQNDTAGDWVTYNSPADAKATRKGLRSSRFEESYAAAAVVADAIGIGNDKKLRQKACSRLDEIEKKEIGPEYWSKYRSHFQKLRKKLKCGKK